MGILNTLIQNSALNGMPKWYKATAIFLFSAIVSLLITMSIMLIIYGPNVNINFGY